MKASAGVRVLTLTSLALLFLSIAGCVGGVMTYGYDDDDGPAFDYDTGVYAPGAFDYGWWGGGEYFGGPPVYEYYGDGDRWRWHHDHPDGDGRFGRGDYHGRGDNRNWGGFGQRQRPYHAAPPSRAIPSIPSRPRGGGFRGGGRRGDGRR